MTPSPYEDRGRDHPDRRPRHHRRPEPRPLLVERLEDTRTAISAASADMRYAVIATRATAA